MAQILRRCDGVDIIYESDGVQPPSFHTIVIIRTTKAVSLRKKILESDSTIERSYIATLPSRIGTIYEQEIVLFYNWRGYKFSIADLKVRANHMYDQFSKVECDLSMKVKFDMDDMTSSSRPLCWNFQFK